MSYQKEVANLLISIGGATTRLDSPFVYSSGMKSPIYCDNRLFISFPRERTLVLDRLNTLIKEVSGESWDLVAGVATAGIPYAAWVAAAFEKPMVYVREAKKEHGKELQIEGKVKEGTKAIVIEDLITTGASAISTVKTLKSHGVLCDACFALFDYEFPKSADAFKAAQIRYFALTGFTALLEALQSNGKIQAHEAEEIIKWHSQEGY